VAKSVRETLKSNMESETPASEDLSLLSFKWVVANISTRIASINADHESGKESLMTSTKFWGSKDEERSDKKKGVIEASTGNDC